MFGASVDWHSRHCVDEQKSRPLSSCRSKPESGQNVCALNMLSIAVGHKCISWSKNNDNPTLITFNHIQKSKNAIRFIVYDPKFTAPQFCNRQLWLTTIAATIIEYRIFHAATIDAKKRRISDTIICKSRLCVRCAPVHGCLIVLAASLVVHAPLTVERRQETRTICFAFISNTIFQTLQSPPFAFCHPRCAYGTARCSVWAIAMEKCARTCLRCWRCLQ